jgi:hypothetical protein
MTPLLRFALLLSCSLFLAPTHGSSQTVPASAPAVQTAAPPAPPAYRSDPRFIAATAEAKKLTATGDLVFAVDAYHKANKLSGGVCTDCLQSAFTLELQQHDFKAAGKEAASILAIVTTPFAKSTANGQRAQALYLQAGDKPKPDQLQAVHVILQTALTEDPGNLAARFLDGTVLARMGQTDAARQQFSFCATHASAADPYRARATRLVQDPALSFAEMAPPFTVTALDGSTFSLNEMKGRVVLLHFWAPGGPPASMNSIS